MDRSTEQPPPPVYARLLCWLGPLAALLLAFQLEFSRMKQALAEAADQATYQIETQVSTFEVALEGFAHFLANASDVGDDEIRTYVQGIRKLYPDLYMFEISSRIEHPQRHAFEQAMRAKGYRNFAIHGFDYAGERQVTPLGARPVYYPIRFIEPESPDTITVLGLDIGSTSTVLVEAMMASLKSSRPIASRPFELLEGGKGYVIYRPVISAPDPPTTDPLLRPLSFAMLAIRAGDLLPDWLQNQDRYTVSLTYKQAIPEAHTELLIEPVRRDNRDLQSWTIRSYTTTAVISSESQPFEMTLSQAIRWSDFRLTRMLTVLLGGSLLSFYMARGLTRAHHRKARTREEEQQLYRRANFDPLTHLPNINLLSDRAEQAIRIADRSGTRVALCYLDIDKFKRINDRWGHHAGDALLVEIALRLQNRLRDEDTAARIHGDEFVVLLPNIAGSPSLEAVTRKILSIFDRPFSIAGEHIRVQGSVGMALFPDDARDLASMLNMSDKRMYRQKHTDEESLAATAEV